MFSRLLHHSEHTISSLQIGHTRLEVAEVAASKVFSSRRSKDILEVRSWASVEVCDVEVEEFKETELVDGESRSEVCFGKRVMAGERDRPLPRTRPPPNFLPDMMATLLEPVGVKW